MSQRLHVCRICGKKFATPKGLCGHQRMHSGLRRILGFKESRIGSCFMTEIEKHEVIEAAMNLVMLSQQVYDFDSIRNLSLGDELMDLEVKSSFKCDICDKSFVCSQALGSHQRLHRSIKGRVLRKNEYIEDDVLLSYSLEAKKVVSKPSSFEVSLHCAESKLDDSGFDKFSSCSKTRLSALHSPLTSSKPRSSYKCKICGKSFVSSQVLGGHQTLHRSVRGQLARKREYTEDDNSLSDSLQAKKIVSQPSSFDVSQDQDKKILQCVEPKLEFHDLLDHSGFDKSSTCKNSRFSALTSSPEDKKIVSQPSSFEISVDKNILQCVEPKLADFGELFAHSGFDKLSSCSKNRSTALHSPLRSKSHSSYRFKICGKSFKCSQALGVHQTLLRSIKGQVECKKEDTEDGDSLSDKTDSEANKFVSQPSSFKSQEM